MPDKGQLTMAEVKFWLSEARSCEERQKIELCQNNNYPLLINYFEGVESTENIYPHVSAKKKMAIINEYFPNTNALVSEIIFQNPDILLSALKPSAEEDLPIMKAALAYFFDKSDALVENRVALFDMLYAGYCAVEVDQMPEPYKAQSDYGQPKQEPQQQGFLAKAMAGIKEAINPEQVENNLALLSPPMEASFATVQGTYLRRYDPLDVPLDWRAERIKDRRYNLKKVWMSKAEFDAKYPDFKDLVNPTDEKFDYSKHGLDMHNRKVLVYEFQVRLKGHKYQTICLSPSYQSRELDTFIRPYTTNCFNMKIGTLHKYGKLYPRSMAQVNKQMADEMNSYVRHLMDVAQRNIPKRLYDKNKVKADAIDSLMNIKVNDMAPVDGNPSLAIYSLPPTQASLENKEMLSIFQDQKNKLWSVSESRISGRSQAQFATDINVQEQGFEERRIDIQEGLRLLMQEQLDTAKDIIVTFWDGEVFLKLTGHEKMDWYEPMTIPDPNDPNKSIVSNPLTDILVADYDVKIDIASARRPNRDQQLARMSAFMQQIVQIRPILIEQGKDINIDEIRRISKEFGWNPDKIFIEHNTASAPTVPLPTGESISPEENARRQQEAEARASGAG